VFLHRKNTCASPVGFTGVVANSMKQPTRRATSDQRFQETGSLFGDYLASYITITGDAMRHHQSLFGASRRATDAIAKKNL